MAAIWSVQFILGRHFVTRTSSLGAMEAKIQSFPQISFQQLFSNLTSVLFSNRNSHQCAHVRFSPACGKVRDENLKMPFPSSAFSPGW